MSFFVRVPAVKTGWTAQCLLLSMCMSFLDLKTDHVSNLPPSVGKYILSRLRDNFEIFSKPPCISLDALYFSDSHYFSDRLVLLWLPYTPLAVLYSSGQPIFLWPPSTFLFALFFPGRFVSLWMALFQWSTCTLLATLYFSGRFVLLCPAHIHPADFYISSHLVLLWPLCISLNGITSMIDLYSSGCLILLWSSCTPLASSYSSGRLLHH